MGSSWSGSHLSPFSARLEQTGLVHSRELLSDRRSVDLLVPGAACQLPYSPLQPALLLALEETWKIKALNGTLWKGSVYQIGKENGLL